MYLVAGVLFHGKKLSVNIKLDVLLLLTETRPITSSV